jgi:tyrosyl-tRNA synthetase
MMNIITDEKRIDEILDRGVIAADGILPTKEEFRKRLLSGEKMRFYIGMDPTAPALHIGHAQNLILLEEFRSLGHEVIFLIGDFTAMIGDPDKSSARNKLSREEVEKNFEGWAQQTKNILSFDDEKNPVQVKHNSEWLSKLNFGDVLELASNFTVQQMLERDMFDKRMHGEMDCEKCGKMFVVKPVRGFHFGLSKSGGEVLGAEPGNAFKCSLCGHDNSGRKNIKYSGVQPIYLHEFMYPLMQGYDSVAMDVDVELCGTDQIFNALAGRTLLQKLKGKDKFVVSANLIADEKTGQLMSKSTGTGVFLDLLSNDLYGAVMSVTDGMIKPLFVGCTRVSLDEIKDLEIEKNPRDAKMRLAFEIVKMFRSEEEAKEAEDYFVRTIQNKEIPDEVPEQVVKWVDAYDAYENVIDFMVSAGLANSKSDARRKADQGGVSIDGKSVVGTLILNKEEHDGKVMKVGKKNFRKIIFS